MVEQYSEQKIELLPDLAEKHGLKIIYDAAHAFGTRIMDRGIGTFGDATMFSFHATKLFHTAEGGALACADPALKARIDDLRNFGIHGPDAVEDGNYAEEQPTVQWGATTP